MYSSMIPLYKPYMPRVFPEMEKILYSGALAYGKWGYQFDKRLSSFIGVENLLSTNSYASAIQVALTALDLQYGDEVITSPMSCLASNMPLLTFGLKVVWADVDPNTGTLLPESVKEKITPKTRLIFHNHYCGYIGYVDEINAIGKEYSIPVMDDCVEAFGSKYKGNYAGNLGTDISIFSFQTVRLPNTIDGGAIIFKDKRLYEKALLIRDFGIRRNIFRDSNGEITMGCDIYMKGYGATMSEINSYIGCCVMDDINDLLARQKQNAKNWKKELVGVKTLERDEIEPNFWVFGVLSNDKIGDLLSFREKGFYASGVHLPNNFYSVFGETSKMKGVTAFYDRFVALPCGWWFIHDINGEG